MSSSEAYIKEKKDYDMNIFVLNDMLKPKLKKLNAEIEQLNAEIKNKQKEVEKTKKNIELLEMVTKHKPSKNKTKKSSPPASIQHDVNKRCPKGYVRNKTTKKCQKK